MAVQKRRKSKATTAQRRSQYLRSQKAPQTILCPRCKEPKLPHRVCAHCGYYHDRQVLVVKEEEA
jgi:large subunit ribosomal protein L32